MHSLSWRRPKGTLRGTGQIRRCIWQQLGNLDNITYCLDHNLNCDHFVFALWTALHVVHSAHPIPLLVNYNNLRERRQPVIDDNSRRPNAGVKCKTTNQDKMFQSLSTNLRSQNHKPSDHSVLNVLLSTAPSPSVAMSMSLNVSTFAVTVLIVNLSGWRRENRQNAVSSTRSNVLDPARPKLYLNQMKTPLLRNHFAELFPGFTLWKCYLNKSLFYHHLLLQHTFCSAVTAGCCRDKYIRGACFARRSHMTQFRTRL